MVDTVTLRDVAQLAGVSIGTASQALNNRPNVAQETRARVFDAALTLGYPIKDPEFSAASSTVKIIGLLVKHDVGQPIEINPFYSYIQVGVERECQKRQISLMYATVEVDLSNHPVVWPAMLGAQQIDGLILAGTFIEETVDLFQRRADVPVVLVDSYAPRLPFDSVVIDNVPATIAAVEYLIQQQHRHIGLIGWNETWPPSIQERKIGYCKALQKHGITDRYIWPADPDRTTHKSGVQQLLKQHPQVTAIFASNDFTALRVLRELRNMGLSVPQDISVVGFDNIDLAKQVTPGLTTVHVHKTWMGALSVRQLVDRTMTPEMPKVTITVSTQLIVRDSVAPPRK